MGKRKAFGSTWWGNEWVKAIKRIDEDTNRLPRGRKYANNGMVSSIDISPGGRVNARVAGTRATPYKVEIEFEEFKFNEINKIKELINKDYVISTELSMGRLPEDFLEALKVIGINLFPLSWNEIKSRCSCPDWANPCKHLAAVYYIIANEIDKDPFILFNLRGIHKEMLFKDLEITQEELKEEKHLPWINLGYDEGYYHNSIGEELNIDLLSGEESKMTLVLKREYDDIDLNKLALSNQGKKVFDLLDNSTLFYPGNFKRLLNPVYNNASKKIDKLELNDSPFSFKNVKFTLLYPYGKGVKDTNFFVSKIEGEISPEDIPFDGIKEELEIPNYEGGKYRLKKEKGMIIPLNEVMDYFLTLPFEIEENKSSPWADFLCKISGVCQSIMKSSSFIPEVKEAEGKGAFYIWYRPLDRLEGLEKVLDYLTSHIPRDFIYLKENKKVLTDKEGVEKVIEIFITSLLFQLSKDLKTLTNVEYQPGQKTKIVNTFFKGEIYRPESFEEMQTGKAITDWLAWLNIEPYSVSPAIKIFLPEKDDGKFKLRLMIESKKNPSELPVPMAEIFSDRKKIFNIPLPSVRREVSRQLVVAGEYMPVLKTLLKHKGQKGARLGSKGIAEFLENTKYILSTLGISIIVPKKLQKLVRPSLSIKATTKKSKNNITYVNLSELLDFSWEVSLGDEKISETDFRKLVKNAGKVIKVKDQYIILTPDEMKKILKKMAKPLPELSSLQILNAAITGKSNGEDFNPDIRLKQMVDELNKGLDKDIKLPENLKALMRPYQTRGFRWLYENTIRGFGSCLADDMGLGKTLQVITLILKLKEEGKLDKTALIVCPTTLIGNWEKEMERFAPSLKTSIYHSSINTQSLKAKNDVDAVITSYGTFQRNSRKFKNKKWGIFVIDEAQNIKNPETKQSKAVKGIKADGFIAMTGTPIENRTLELWSIFDFLNTGYLGKQKEFMKNYAIPIEKFRDSKKIKLLRKLTEPFVMRRMKTDKKIIKDLPQKIVNDEYCYLSKEQTALYQHVTETVFKEIEERDGIERKGMVLKLITSLKQICNHPCHYTKNNNLKLEGSGKSEKALSLLKEFISKGEKSLIFTQYKEMGYLLNRLIQEELQIKPLFFHGSLERKKRDEIVREFQNKDNNSSAMIISLKAGGTGLNLTTASNVIHYDLWWNPAVEDQATDRTYRIGQTKNVIVHRLINVGTFEEKINKMINDKRELAELTVSAGEKRITEMSNSQLKELFQINS